MAEHNEGSRPTPQAPWRALPSADLPGLFAGTNAHWWLSDDAALERWLGHPIRDGVRTAVSTLPADLRPLTSHVGELQPWGLVEGKLAQLEEVPPDADVQWVDLFDPFRDAWVLRIHVEDGGERGWMYRRDPRLQLPWDAAVLDIGGVPTGAPQVQLLWKALRPTPEDDRDRAEVLPALTDEQREWLERAIARIHPHSSWAIERRSPLNPARASWHRNR